MKINWHSPWTLLLMCGLVLGLCEALNIGGKIAAHFEKPFPNTPAIKEATVEAHPMSPAIERDGAINWCSCMIGLGINADEYRRDQRLLAEGKISPGNREQEGTISAGRASYYSQCFRQLAMSGNLEKMRFADNR